MLGLTRNRLARDRPSRRGADHDGLQERVAGQSVRAVQARVRHFARCPEPREAGSAVLVDHDAAHVEMGGACHRDRGSSGLDALRPARRQRRGKTLRVRGTEHPAGIENDIASPLLLPPRRHARPRRAAQAPPAHRHRA